MDGETRDGGKVIRATAFEDRTMAFKDLIKESISHSYNDYVRKKILIMLITIAAAAARTSGRSQSLGFPLAKHNEVGLSLFK